jgi:hypothetical protein
MKHGVISFSSVLLFSLVAAPLAAWADANPDFDDDAKPILHLQPGLLQYVESHFEVKDTGTAKFPGDDDRRPSPPYIFRARPAGSDGPYNLRLLIQPGQPGHILGVVDITKMHARPPGAAPAQQPPEFTGQPQTAPANQAPANEPRVGEAFSPPSASSPEPQPAPQEVPPAPAPSAPANAAPTEPASGAPSDPTADTPSGPIMSSPGSGNSATPQPSLTPPPDPAPNAQ